MNKQSALLENLTILNIYMPSNRASKHTTENKMQKLFLMSSIKSIGQQDEGNYLIENSS